MKILNRVKFKNRLRKIPKAVRKQVERDLDIGADEMVEVAKRFAPEDDGVLRRSIRKERSTKPLKVKVKAGGAETTREARRDSGVEYDYALGQEFGTQEQDGQPYFWPAYRLTKRRRNSRVTRNANKIIKRIFAR